MGFPKNSTVVAADIEMNYVTFGRGDKTLVMLPGLGDGLATVKGTALPFALAYRRYGRDYTVYLFSRRENLAPGTTTREMAADQAAAMEALGIARAHVVGVSQGGMVAQYLAIDHPELVDRLVLAVTSGGPTPHLKEAVEGWMDLAQRGDCRGLMVDTAERTYSEAYLKKYRHLYPLLGRVGRPKGFDRFLIQGAACLSHDARGELGRIGCPTLIIGGGQDKILGPEAAPALAAAIPNSTLYIYDTLGHGAYEEGRDFHRRVLEFLTKAK